MTRGKWCCLAVLVAGLLPAAGVLGQPVALQVEVAPATACEEFNVTVTAVDDADPPVADAVVANTVVELSVTTGTGELAGELIGVIAAGDDNVVLAVTYSVAEEGVVLTATRISGDDLEAGASEEFDVEAGEAFALAIEPIDQQVIDAEFSVTVVVQDACGDEIVVAGAPVTVTLDVGEGAGALAGTLVRAINVGESRITFPGISYDTAEEDVTITADDGGALEDAESDPFDVIDVECAEDVDCDDEDLCTTDTCGEDGFCVNAPVECPDGVCNPADGACVECVGDADCDDGVVCNGVETCGEDNLCVAGESICAIGVCDEVLDKCVECAGAEDCDDDDACTDDACVDSVCVSTPVVCDDADACTDDACVDGECVFTEIVCDDADLCTTDECVEGECVFTEVVCEDEGDICDPATGACIAPCVDDAGCDDALFCNGAETCNAETGLCEAGDDPCLEGQVCDEDLDVCRPCLSDAECDDGDACTDDVCDLEAGECVSTPVVCDDADACTTDECVDGECVFTAIVCDDADACTTDECVDGECVFTAVVCDDGDACTTDECVDGECVFTAIVCDDADACTTDECVDGECVFTAVVCDDGDACTDDACDAETGECVSTPVDCDDGDACTTDACVGGACVNTPIVCDNGNFCDGEEVCVDGECVDGDAPCAAGEFCDEANDECDECQVDADCDDGLFCTGVETCSATGACVAGTPPCDEELGETCNEELDQCEVCFDLFGCGPFCTPVMALTVFGLVALRFTSRRRRA